MDRLPKDRAVVVTVHQPRNREHLAKYWSICSVVADADPAFDDRDDADHWVRVHIPWMHRSYEVVEADGEVRTFIRVKSINVESMGEPEFKKFYDRAMTLFSERIGMDVEDLAREVWARNRQRRAPALRSKGHDHND